MKNSRHKLLKNYTIAMSTARNKVRIRWLQYSYLVRMCVCVCVCVCGCMRARIFWPLGQSLPGGKFFLLQRWANVWLVEGGTLPISFGRENPAVSAQFLNISYRAFGIPISTFKAHFIRAASTSKTNTIGAPVKRFLRGHWSRTSTFQKHY